MECENSNCVIKQCDKQYLSELDENKNQILIGAGEYIFREDSEVIGIYLIQTGKVKIISTDSQGNKSIVRLAKSGQIIGHQRSNSTVDYEVGAIALTETRMCFIKEDDLKEAYQKNFELLESVMMFYSNELKESEARSHFLTRMSVEERVVFAILYLIECFGFDRNSKELNVAMSRIEIGQIARTNADQVSRSISSLKTQSIISSDGRIIFIQDYQALCLVVSKYKAQDR